jgi:hypothetical protein
MVGLPSERSFGWLFCGVFALLALYGWRAGWAGSLVILSGLAATTMAAVSLVCPRLLAAPNRAWHRLGLFLGKIVSPLVMAVIFFVLLTPVGLLARLFGRDELRLKLQPDAQTYWVDRAPPGPDAGSYKQQF